jgi:hypothetical protein
MVNCKAFRRFLANERFGFYALYENGWWGFADVDRAGRVLLNRLLVWQSWEQAALEGWSVRMKPLPAPKVPGKTEFERFDNAVRQILTVSKQDVLRREAEQKQTHKPKAKRP